MSESSISGYIFRQAAQQNRAVADNLAQISERLRETRQTGKQILRGPVVASSPLFSGRIACGDLHIPMYSAKRCGVRNSTSILGIAILVAGLVAIGYVVGPTIYKIFIASWKTILLSLGGVCVGSGFILLFGKIGKKPLKNVEPPDGSSDHPLEELEGLAFRTVSRLKTAYQLQIILTCSVATLLLFVVLWSIYMVTQNQLMYATAFGSSGIGMLILSKWKWQPFERVAEARKLADDADILAAGLRLRIKSISEIPDPKERAQAQWDAVSEYLDRS
jgi:hypothetical protein